MKKIFLLLTLVLAVSVTFTACKKDPKKSPTDETGTNPDKETDPFKLSYSNLTQEEHKKDLEINGVEFINNVNDIPDQTSVKAITALLDLEPEISVDLNMVSTLFEIGQAASKRNLNNILSSISTSNDPDNLPEKLSDFYGIYTYDKASSTFTEEPSDDRFEISFPSTAGSISNNAIITITYTSAGQTITIDGESAELPSAINASLKVDGKEELKMTSTFEYKSDGLPKKTDIALEIGTYKFTLVAKNENNEAEAQFSLLKGTETLMKLQSTGKGTNVVLDSLENVEYVDEILHEANATFEIMDIKLAGFFDVKQYGSASRENDPYPVSPDYNDFFYQGIENDQAAMEKAQAAFQAALDKYQVEYEIADKEWAEKEASNMNSFAKFVAINTSTNSLIAKAEFKAVKETDTYCYQEFDPSSNSYKEVCYTSTWYNVDPLLIFKDDSKVSFNTFGETGFDQFIKDFEKFADKFE